MNMLDLIQERGSYRAAFRDEEISRDTLKKILKAGTEAPSGCNRQTTRFYGTNDPEKARAIAEIYGFEWAKTAPACILVLAPRDRESAEHHYIVHDYSAAIENMLLAIESLSLNTCRIEGQILGEKAEAMAREIQLSEDLMVVVYLPLGQALKERKRPKKLSFDERVRMDLK